jgi:hypothetical protein
VLILFVAQQALVGKGAPGLSASTIARLKEVSTEEHAHWQKRDLFSFGAREISGWRRSGLI